MGKTYVLNADQIVRLIPHNGGCIATDRITVDGCKVGYMYREETDIPEDTGWRFFEGNETQKYIDDADNSAFYSVNTIANYDPEILEFLETPPPCEFEKDPKGKGFKRIEE